MFDYEEKTPGSDPFFRRRMHCIAAFERTFSAEISRQDSPVRQRDSQYGQGRLMSVK